MVPHLAVLLDILTPLEGEDGLPASHAGSHEDERLDFQFFKEIDGVVRECLVADVLGVFRETSPVAIPKSTSIRSNAPVPVSFAKGKHQLLIHQGIHGPSMNEDEGRLGASWFLWLRGGSECNWMCCRNIVSVEEIGTIEWTTEARHFEG